MGVAGEGHRIAVGQAVAGYGDVERGSRAPHPDNPGQPTKPIGSATVIRLRRGWWLAV
jgi:hypothetical protein